MVENSLGRLWLESHPNENLKANWIYYLDEAEQEPEVELKLAALRAQSPIISPEDIQLIDPCMGSGHILIYAFDVLMQIYESEGYTPRDAARLILEKNIYGLDIDQRAYQLAYFSLMMKARQYNRRILTEGIAPQVYHPAGYPEGQEYGSLIKIDQLPPQPVEGTGQLGIEDIAYNQQINAWHFQRLLAQKYDVVVTNPPYAGSKGFNSSLLEMVQLEFPDYKADLFAVFISRCKDFSKYYGFVGMITPTAWMYNPRFKITRSKLIREIELSSLVELGDDAFEVGFGTVMFVFSKSHLDGKYLGKYYDVGTNKEKENFKKTKSCIDAMNSFYEYEDRKISYKITGPYREILLGSKKLSEYGQARAGLQTDDNARFIREWFEVSFDTISFNQVKGLEFGDEKWFPHVRGGRYWKWYGNFTNVVNWQYGGKEIIDLASSKYGSYTKRVQSQEYYFCSGLHYICLGL